MHRLLAAPISIAVIAGLLGEAPYSFTIAMAGVMAAIGIFTGAIWRIACDQYGWSPFAKVAYLYN